MPRFFVSDIPKDIVNITGESATHITKSLRMKPGDKLTLCDGFAHDYICEIASIGDTVILKVLDCLDNISEPSLKAHLYQAMPKGDKFENIIQKSVELGVTQITPVLTSRCVSRPNDKAMQKKLIRYRKIAHEAAKQSGRGIIPQINPMINFDTAVNQMKEEKSVLFYECSGKSVSDILKPADTKISFMVGSEGGFAPEEVEFAKSSGIEIANLGPRILRCETAPLCVLSIFMFFTQNF